MPVSNLQTDEARKVYIAFLDYLIMCGDPLYRKLCAFAKRINSLSNESDKKYITAYFEKETNQSITYFKNPNA